MRNAHKYAHSNHSRNAIYVTSNFSGHHPSAPLPVTITVTAIKGVNILPQSTILTPTQFGGKIQPHIKGWAWEDLQAAEPFPSSPSSCHPTIHSLSLQPVQLLKHPQDSLAEGVAALLVNNPKSSRLLKGFVQNHIRFMVVEIKFTCGGG